MHGDHSRLRREDLEDRDEAKEDEYDYLTPQGESDENQEGRLDYHVMDDGGDPDDEEMLDEDEKRARDANMLKELYEKLENE
jgi:hypothetical protein